MVGAHVLRVGGLGAFVGACALYCDPPVAAFAFPVCAAGLILLWARSWLVESYIVKHLKEIQRDLAGLTPSSQSLASEGRHGAL
jgi:hypothetical protein